MPFPALRNIALKCNPSLRTPKQINEQTYTPQMAKSSRGAPSQFDILTYDLDSDEDTTITRDNFELSTTELQEHYVMPVGLAKWMKDKKRSHTLFIRYQSTNDIQERSSWSASRRGTSRP